MRSVILSLILFISTFVNANDLQKIEKRIYNDLLTVNGYYSVFSFNLSSNSRETVFNKFNLIHEEVEHQFVCINGSLTGLSLIRTKVNFPAYLIKDVYPKCSINYADSIELEYYSISTGNEVFNVFGFFLSNIKDLTEKLKFEKSKAVLKKLLYENNILDKSQFRQYLKSLKKDYLIREKVGKPCEILLKKLYCKETPLLVINTLLVNPRYDYRMFHKLRCDE